MEYELAQMRAHGDIGIYRVYNGSQETLVRVDFIDGTAAFEERSGDREFDHRALSYLMANIHE